MRRTISTALGLLAFAGALYTGPAAAQQRTKLAVLDLRDKGVGASTAENLTDVLTVSLNELGVFDVLSRADIQQMIAFEQEKQLVGCESDTSCLAEIGGALGVALLVNGSVGQVGSGFIINLALTDAKSAKVLAREQRQVGKADELAEQMNGAARFLVRGLLQGAEGYLILQSSESGADVEVDGRIIGVTPLARQNLNGGPHTVRVVKKGFVTWARDIDIAKGEPLVVEAALVPSLEFIAEYDARADSWRRMAYISGGLGISGLAFGLGGWWWNGRRADDYEVRLAAAHCGVGDSTAPTSNCSSFADEHDAMRRFDLIAQAAGWTGAVLLSVGAYLYRQGPKPNIYDQYKPDTAQATVLVAPLPRGGAQVSAAWLF